MGVEAQRLIAVSLGKIAASRNQRGGPNLHRSLLVSAVLYKARTAFMIDLQHMRQQSRLHSEAEQSSTGVDYPPRPQTPAPQPTPVKHEAPTAGNPEGTPKRSRVTVEENKENSPPRNKPTEPNNNVSKKSEDIVEEKDNSSCGKCVKRRLTDVGENEDSDCKSDGVSAKRIRFSENNDSKNTDTEEMQCDCPQISSLVMKFNSGLSGLLTPSTNGNTQQQKQDVFSMKSTTSSSCSTQVDHLSHGLESLSQRPAIALTV